MLADLNSWGMALDALEQFEEAADRYEQALEARPRPPVLSTAVLMVCLGRQLTPAVLCSYRRQHMSCTTILGMSGGSNDDLPRPQVFTTPACTGRED